MAEHPGLVHHDFRRADDRDDLHRLDSVGWKNIAAIESPAGASPALRLRLLDRDLLVRVTRNHRVFFSSFEFRFSAIPRAHAHTVGRGVGTRGSR